MNGKAAILSIVDSLPEENGRVLADLGRGGAGEDAAQLGDDGILLESHTQLLSSLQHHTYENSFKQFPSVRVAGAEAARSMTRTMTGTSTRTRRSSRSRRTRALWIRIHICKYKIKKEAKGVRCKT